LEEARNHRIEAPVTPRGAMDESDDGAIAALLTTHNHQHRI